MTGGLSFTVDDLSLSDDGIGDVNLYFGSSSGLLLRRLLV